MSTLRVSNIEAKADVSSPSVNEKVKVTNSNGELLIHIDGATSGITTVGISTSGESFRFDSNQNVTFFGSVTGTGLDVNGNADISGNLNVGGVLTYEDVTSIDSVGVITARSDVSIADKIVHTGDTDTAIRFPGADQVSIETGGTQRLLIGSDGKLVHSTSGTETVDFGTSNGSGAYHKYDLGASGATVGYIGAGSLIVSGANVADFGVRGQANLVFASGGDTERLRITSDGKVVISRFDDGSAGPYLELYNNSESPADNDYTGSINFKNNNSASEEILYAEIRGISRDITDGSEDGEIQFHTERQGSFGERVRICADQATGSNESRLDIIGGNVNVANIDEINGSLRFRSNDASVNSTENVGSQISAITEASNGAYVGMGFYTFQQGSRGLAESLRITNAGKLATNGASSIDCGAGGMHLYLGDGARNDYSTSADGLIIEKNGTTGLSIDPGSSGTANIYFPNESNHSIASISHNNSTGELRVRGEDHIILSTNNNTERLRINSVGDLILANYKKLFNQNNNHLALIAVGESTPTIYVSDSGDDSTGDGTSSSPFRTITKAWNYIPKVFTHIQTARIMIKGTSYTIDADYYMRGGASGGNWQWGPAVEIRSESGSQIDVYLRRGWRFENVDGLRFNHLNFICDNANGYLYFNSCARGKIYNTCDMTVSATKGWSERVTYDNCQQFVDDMDIDVTSAASSGLGGLVVVRSKSSLSGTRYITKAGSVFGNSAVSVSDDALVSCNWDVTNFATGYAFGYNHYNAETNGIGMLNGVTISNCTTGIRLRNNSFVRKYSLTYSGNSTNEDIQSGSFVN